MVLRMARVLRQRHDAQHVPHQNSLPEGLVAQHFLFPEELLPHARIIPR